MCLNMAAKIREKTLFPLFLPDIYGPMTYLLEIVRSSRQWKSFLNLPHRLYQGDPNWVCPLDMEIRQVFNPGKNPFYKEGEACLWIAKDETGQTIGRIAAFINRAKAFKFEVPTGGIGFFECINDQDAAHQLFDVAREWLQERNMEAMDGPINFGENDRFWGLLVEGFTTPVYGMAYHLPYYQELFETYGFQVYFRQESSEMSLVEPLPDRVLKIAKWVQGKEGLEFRLADPKNPYAYARAMQEIYNEAWKMHEHFSPMTDEQVDSLVQDFKHILIRAFLPYAYVRGEAAAFLVAMPDLNQIFRPLKGKFSLWQKILFKWRSRNEFAWYRKKGILTDCRVVIIGVKPQFQRYGLEVGMIISGIDIARNMGFKRVELSWVGDFNPKMQRLYQSMGAEVVHIHHTYRYMFDQQQEFKRAKSISFERTKVKS